MTRKKLVSRIAASITALATVIGAGFGIHHINNESNTKTKKPEGSIEIHYIDVGQGDATLIKCDGQTMLIDAGENDKGSQVWSYLKSQNVSKLDYVIGTHPDSDHIGGMDVIIYKFQCDNVFMSSFEKDTYTKKKFTKLKKKCNLNLSSISIICQWIVSPIRTLMMSFKHP